MENITHKIKFKSGEHEIEIIGTKKFTEHWFEKIHKQIEGSPGNAAVELPEGIRKRKPSKKAPAKPKAAAYLKSGTKKKRNIIPFSVPDCVIHVAYDLQEKQGMSHIFIADIRAGMMQANLKIPEKSGYLSHAIRANLVRGYLQRTEKKIGTQKAFCVSKDGKKYVEGGFKKAKSRK